MIYIFYSCHLILYFKYQCNLKGLKIEMYFIISILHIMLMRMRKGNRVTSVNLEIRIIYFHIVIMYNNKYNYNVTKIKITPRT